MIVLNIDGVVVDLDSELQYLLDYDESVSRDRAGFRWSDVYSDIPEDVLNSTLLNPLTYKNAKPFEDAWYWVNHYSSEYDIMYVTSRDTSLTSLTWQWFVDWDLPADFVVFEKDKPYFLPQLEISIYVDDHPDIVKYLDKMGIKAFLINRYYNLDYDIDDNLRIDSLWDIKCV